MYDNQDHFEHWNYGEVQKLPVFQGKKQKEKSKNVVHSKRNIQNLQESLLKIISVKDDISWLKLS